MPLLPLRRLDVDEDGETTVVTLTRVKIPDDQSVKALGEQLFRLVDRVGLKKMVLDFEEVDYFPSTMFVVLAPAGNRTAPQRSGCGSVVDRGHSFSSAAPPT